MTLLEDALAELWRFASAELDSDPPAHVGGYIADPVVAVAAIRAVSRSDQRAGR